MWGTRCLRCCGATRVTMSPRIPSVHNPCDVAQLTQVLKFEPFNDSALARYLIRRAVRNPAGVGHMFYWYLQAEMHLPEVGCLLTLCAVARGGRRSRCE